MVSGLAGEIDMTTAPAVRDQLLEYLERGHLNLVVDLQEVEFLDSTGLSALIVVYRRARQLGGHLRVAAPRPNVRRILEITRLDVLFDVHDDVEGAVRKLSDDLAVEGGK